jgi:hypothetical protein
MTSLAQHSSSTFAKVLYLGDSGAGKTGSLTSLVAAGYKLKILDMDNGVGILRQFVKKECPDKIDNVDVVTRRDRYVSSITGPIVRTPKAFVAATELLNKWEDGTIPAEWGPEVIFVLDTMTALGRAAYNWAEGMNRDAKDKRQIYFAAQQGLEKIIALLTGEDFKTNVIIISHVQYMDNGKGYATTIGSALGPTVPTFFNNLIMAQVGAGRDPKREIVTLPTGIVDLKTEKPFVLNRPLPLGTGLATVFEELRK